MCGMAADLTVDIADDSGENPEDQHVVRQLKAGEHVLTKVMREQNTLQDANTKRLRRGIFSKCLNEPLKRGRRRSRLIELCLQVC